jgi:hypothetical protein
MNQVFTLAAAFITECPSTNPTLPVHAFPSLTFANPSPGANSTLSFTPASTPPSGPLYVAFFTGLDTIFVEISDGAVVIPSQLLGTVYAVVTDSGNSTEDENIVAGPAILLFDFDSQGNLITQ